MLVTYKRYGHCELCFTVVQTTAQQYIYIYACAAATDVKYDHLRTLLLYSHYTQQNRFDVHVFSIASWSEDPLYIRVRGSVPTKNFHELSADDLSAATAIIKAQQLDVLIYPELGLDPVSYWLSFQKLAPSQVNLRTLSFLLHFC
jgi:hypothetical protein